MSATYLHLGGLVAVGFDPAERFLLVVSHSGRGVFDTNTWQRVARDALLAYPNKGYVGGIGPIEGVAIAVTELASEDATLVRSPTGRISLECTPSGIQVID